MNVNKVILMGRVGKEPEIAFTPSKAQVAKFSIATSKKWKDKEGKPNESTEWHRVIAWQGLAGIVEKYIHKGTPVYVEGELQTRQWTDKSGVVKYVTEIVANQVMSLSDKPRGTGVVAPARNGAYYNEEESRKEDQDTVSEKSGL